jgi:integrase
MSRPATVWWNKQKDAWCTDIGGSRRVLAKGKANKTLAQEKLRDLLEEQRLLADVNGAITVAALCEAFVDDAEENLAERTHESCNYACQKFIDCKQPKVGTLGVRAAHTIRPQDIAHFRRSLERLGPTSQAIVLRSIQRCFNWGVEENLIPEHKLGRVRKPRALKRERYLTDDEFRVLIRATNPVDGSRRGAPFRRFLYALDWTLCRPGELARLKWEHLHLEHDVAILEDHKTKRTGNPKIIPLVPKVQRLLAWIKKHQKSEYCFLNLYGRPWSVGVLNQRMRRARNRCGLQDVCPYTIRHRAATNAIVRTGDLKMTSLLLGHTSTATTERYTHLAQQHLVTFAKKAIG